jgi:hypothetical protein
MRNSIDKIGNIFIFYCNRRIITKTDNTSHATNLFLDKELRHCVFKNQLESAGQILLDKFHISAV